MSATNTSQNLSLARLSTWATGYSFRRGWSLLGVSGSLLSSAALDVLKPWPMVFLIDYVLRGKVLPPLLERFVQALPGPATPSVLIGWSVGGTVLVFLLSWVAGLAASYSNISLGQRMTYDLAGDLFAKLQQLSMHRAEVGFVTQMGPSPDRGEEPDELRVIVDGATQRLAGQSRLAQCRVNARQVVRDAIATTGRG